MIRLYGRGLRRKCPITMHMADTLRFIRLLDLNVIGSLIRKVPTAANWMDVCLQNTSKSHSYFLKNMAFIMTLWIGNVAVLKSSSQ